MPRKKDTERHSGGTDSLKLVAPDKSFPRAPEGLDATGRAAWRRGKPLWEEGILTERRLRAWETYCKAVQEVKHCEKIAKAEGEYKVQHNGTICQHPAIKRRQAAENTMFRYEERFGLVPSQANAPPKKKKPAITARGRTG